MYMDDVLHSAETEAEAIKTREQLTELLSCAGFEVRRWCSNKENVLKDVPEEDRVSGVNIEESELPSMKALGVQWDAGKDVFTYAVKEIEGTVFTKRALLSRIATLFDPLQYLAPFVIRTKMMLQEAWLRGLDWDEEFPDDLKVSVKKWMDELPSLKRVQIPRCYNAAGTEQAKHVSLHTFSDVSQAAYAAVTYIRYEQIDGNTEISFVAAKAKVTPIKAISIPRLELMAAVMGVRLADTITAILNVPADQRLFWSDSMDVFHWVQGHSRHYKPFVAHRVSEIQQKTNPTQWRHVPGKMNSADDATRGLNAEDLVNGSRWLEGPAFLYQKEESWPSTLHSTESDCTEEARKESTRVNIALAVHQVNELLDAERFSNWVKLLRVTAWVLRFVTTLKASRGKTVRGKVDEQQSDSLTTEEMERAEKYWICRVQRNEFHEDCEELKTGKALSKSSRLKALDPFLDQDSVLRVGGRLQHSSLPYDAKHPIILPKRNWISRLIVFHVHRNSYHSRGTNCILAELRQKYWVIHGREVVKQALLGLVYGSLIRDAKHATSQTRHDPNDRGREEKTRQDKTRQDKTRQDKTRQDKTRQDKTREEKRREEKRREDKTRQDKTREEKRREEKRREEKRREEKRREEKRREEKRREEKRREERREEKRREEKRREEKRREEKRREEKRREEKRTEEKRREEKRRHIKLMSCIIEHLLLLGSSITRTTFFVNALFTNAREARLIQQVLHYDR
ncbi:hypothetical protein QZH41_007496 [Actinostola sp. cb2023]|nr:hypothetical protein QZH41_007496 [Actinostola sp. cb2023]